MYNYYVYIYIMALNFELWADNLDPYPPASTWLAGHP